MDFQRLLEQTTSSDLLGGCAEYVSPELGDKLSKANDEIFRAFIRVEVEILERLRDSLSPEELEEWKEANDAHLAQNLINEALRSGEGAFIMPLGCIPGIENMTTAGLKKIDPWNVSWCYEYVYSK